MPHVLTLVGAPGALSHDHLRAAKAALAALGADLDQPAWLSEAEALDLPFQALAAEQAVAAVRAALGDAPLDLIAQPRAGRRKKLLLADMDSTIVTTETLDEIAAFAGLKAPIAAITLRAMNGELDFKAALRERVAMLAGLDAGVLEQVWAETALMPGAAELVGTMRAAGARTVLVSGGFDFFTSRVAERVGFHDHEANALRLEGGRLTGAVAEPIRDRDSKLAALKRWAAAVGAPLDAAAAVGDGANDLPMLQAAGLGVAFRAKPGVAAAARHRVTHGDLSALLFAQGYRRAEFARAALSAD